MSGLGRPLHRGRFADEATQKGVARIAFLDLNEVAARYDDLGELVAKDGLVNICLIACEGSRNLRAQTGTCYARDEQAAKKNNYRFHCPYEHALMRSLWPILDVFTGMNDCPQAD